MILVLNFASISASVNGIIFSSVNGCTCPVFVSERLGVGSEDSAGFEAKSLIFCI